jgi:glycosyltransferase involved in cell wall biosynthesis
VPLILVGSKGWIYAEIFATIEQLGLQDQVRHLSGIYDEALAHLYRAAGVLVTPSHYEGFGLPALEAMHSGCPVIVSNRGSLPEVVGPAGLLLEPDDVTGWAEALTRVLTDSGRRNKMVAQGKAQAATFSWPRTAEKMAALYEQVVQAKL